MHKKNTLKKKSDAYLWVVLLELRPTPRWRTVTSGWAGESWNTTLLPHQQKKVITPAAQMLPLKMLPWKSLVSSFGSFEHKLPILPAWPCDRPFSTPNSDVSVHLASLCIGHMDLDSSHVCPSFLFWSKYLEIRFYLNAFQNIMIMVINSEL